MESKIIYVTGIVQGVGFRYTTLQIANELKIYGTVKNLADGSVQIVLQGSSLKINEMINHLHNFPNHFAKISKLKIKDIDLPEKYSSFKIET
ncbi:acylphosphatase [Fructilactobacillus vespulae]|uniref:acylphosphatase n=1 Tax=Fructilactobacillus vespulae TaxID=1249630 RepID=UPI0039B3A9CA